MERFVQLMSPNGRFDFFVKLIAIVLVCGGLNHLRHWLFNGFVGHKTFLINLTDASFTALPMSALALALIAHLNSLQKRLYSQANEDVLTGLPNRTWFMANVPDPVGPEAAMLMIDLDHFKAVNDTHGHEAGDACLQQFAHHLRGCLQEDAMVARIGGEEFVVYLPNPSDAELAELGACISAGFDFEAFGGKTFRITASVGIAKSGHRLGRSMAMRIADKAVYQAKSDGRARVVTQTSCQDDPAERTLSLAS